MAVGARLLAKKEAIVTRLAAIEELAGVDVLCSDKTGTLTQNKLTLGDPFCVDGVPADQVILNAALASRAENNGHHRSGRARRSEKRSGPECLPGGPFPAVRPGAQTHRSDRQGRGRKAVQGDQGRAAGDPGVVGQCRAGENRHRAGRQRIRGARLPLVGRGAGRGRRPLAVSRRAAPVRPAPGRSQGDHRDRSADGRERSRW